MGIGLENNERYAKYVLTATIKKVKVRLRAVSVDEAHKDRTLKLWKQMRAKDIQITERQPEPLPLWDVSYHNNKRFISCEMNGSSAEAIEDRLDHLYGEKNVKLFSAKRKETADAATRN